MKENKVKKINIVDENELKDVNGGRAYNEEWVCPKCGYVELKAVASPDFAWLTYAVPMVLGTDLEGSNSVSYVKMCDFGSAGNTWDKAVRYRVWLPKTLHVMTTPYVPYNRDPNGK